MDGCVSQRMHDAELGILNGLQRRVDVLSTCAAGAGVDLGDATPQAGKGGKGRDRTRPWWNGVLPLAAVPSGMHGPSSG
jgi:hypothetical protein